MKHTLFIIFLLMAGAAYASDGDKKAKDEKPSDCIVYFSSERCIGNNEVHCYHVTWNGGSEYYFVSVSIVPYGVSSSAYTLHYSYKNVTYALGEKFPTEGETLSYFVHTEFGESCTYNFK